MNMTVPTVILLAGGKGTRLGDVSSGLPKPLVEVGSRPFAGYIVEWVQRQGAGEIYMNLNLGNGSAARLGDSL